MMKADSISLIKSLSSFLTLYQKVMITSFAFTACHRFASAIIFVTAPFIRQSWIALDRPIFIVGCSRSGTSLIGGLLAGHDDIADWSEGGQIFDIAYHDPEGDQLKEAGDVTPFQKLRVRVLLGLFTRLKGKKRFLNRNPHNSMRVRYIKEIFPDAVIIHMIRDGRAVTLSNFGKTRDEKHRHGFPFGYLCKPPAWREYLGLPILEQFAHQWTDVVDYVRTCSEDKEIAGDYIEVQYEDVCRDTYSSVERLDKFCGLSEDGRSFEGIEDMQQDRGIRSIEAALPETISCITPILSKTLEQMGYRISPEPARN